MSAGQGQQQESRDANSQGYEGMDVDDNHTQQNPFASQAFEQKMQAAQNMQPTQRLQALQKRQVLQRIQDAQGMQDAQRMQVEHRMQETASAGMDTGDDEDPPSAKQQLVRCFSNSMKQVHGRIKTWNISDTQYIDYAEQISVAKTIQELVEEARRDMNALHPVLTGEEWEEVCSKYYKLLEDTGREAKYLITLNSQLLN